MKELVVRIEAHDQPPACPHCRAPLTELRMIPGEAQESTLITLIIDTFCCPACGGVLSVSGRK